jgi:hypothetical protein
MCVDGMLKIMAFDLMLNVRRAQLIIINNKSMFIAKLGAAFALVACVAASQSVAQVSV